jgi:hypothetical protein
MKCFSLLLGARQTPGAGRRFSRRDDQVIRDLTFRYFPAGFTILNAAGGWFDPARKKFVEEDSRQILVCAERRAALRTWCEALAGALRQKELLVVELGPADAFLLSRVRRRRSISRTRQRG